MIKLPSDFSPAERGQRAGGLFRQGYNCCQSVLLAFADVLELNALAGKEVLAAIGSGFGGGMGRMREVCGAFSGMAAMSGFISPAVNPAIMDERKENYALVQKFAGQFKDCNGGSIVCRELLGIPNGKGGGETPENPLPSARTAEYYRKRPCVEIVSNAARIVAEEFISSVSEAARR